LHEWALAESIIMAVVDLAKRENAKEILEVELLVGELQTLNIEVLEFALNELKRGTMAENAKIKFSKQFPRFKCIACGNVWEIRNLENILSRDEIESIHFIPELSHVFIKCPRCGSNDFQVTEGRGIILKGVVLKK